MVETSWSTNGRSPGRPKRRRSEHADAAGVEPAESGQHAAILARDDATLLDDDGPRRHGTGDAGTVNRDFKSCDEYLDIWCSAMQSDI